MPERKCFFLLMSSLSPIFTKQLLSFVQYEQEHSQLFLWIGQTTLGNEVTIEFLDNSHKAHNACNLDKKCVFGWYVKPLSKEMIFSLNRIWIFSQRIDFHIRIFSGKIDFHIRLFLSLLALPTLSCNQLFPGFLHLSDCSLNNLSLEIPFRKSSRWYILLYIFVFFTRWK